MLLDLPLNGVRGRNKSLRPFPNANPNPDRVPNPVRVRGPIPINPSTKYHYLGAEYQHT